MDYGLAGVPICRIAKNSTSIIDNKLKTKTITDNVGKNDWLKLSATGTMALLAYAELLRTQKDVITGTLTVPIIPDLLPRQWLHIHAKKKSDGTFSVDKDFRVIRIEHGITVEGGYFTTVSLTDDLTNSHTRPAYTDFNKVLESIRPQAQDRQASSIKFGEVDINIPIFEQDYPS